MIQIVVSSLLDATAVITFRKTNPFHQPVYVTLHTSLLLLPLLNSGENKRLPSDVRGPLPGQRFLFRS